MISSRQKAAALKEVYAALQRAARNQKTDPEQIRRYMNSELKFFGISVPAQRRVSNSGFSFLKLPRGDVLTIWDFIWHNSDNFEVMSQAPMYYGQKSQQDFLSTAWPVISRWSKRIENWAHSDSLSSLYVRILEQQQHKVFPTLLRWNKSPHPWLRRQSVVSILYYSSARHAVLPFEKIIPLVKNLLHDEEYYVQKGVGWTLRELSNVHPGKTRKFLVEHAEHIHPAAFGAAVEKVSAKEKELLKALRRRHRSER